MATSFGSVDWRTTFSDQCFGCKMTMRSGVFCGILTLVALASACPTSSFALDRITLAVASIERIIYLPAALAEQLGYFRQEGLDVEFHNVTSGNEGVDELLAGAAQGVVGFYDHTIDLQAKGKVVTSVVQLALSPGEAVLVSATMADRISSTVDFKGKKLGVTGLGSSTSFLMQYLAVAQGVKLNEITLVPVGMEASFAAAMKNGTIDVGMTTEPTVSGLLKAGQAKMLIDLRMPENAIKLFGGLYPAACLYMQASWVNSHKPQVQQLVNALVKALQYIQMHSAEEIASRVPAQYYSGNRDAYVRALANSKAIFTPDGLMPDSGPPIVLKVLSTFDKNIQAQRIDLSRTYTTEFASAAATRIAR
jgi:NitT/TauT family transport system substrate-binding protein